MVFPMCKCPEWAGRQIYSGMPWGILSVSCHQTCFQSCPGCCCKCVHCLVHSISLSVGNWGGPSPKPCRTNTWGTWPSSRNTSLSPMWMPTSRQSKLEVCAIEEHILKKMKAFDSKLVRLDKVSRRFATRLCIQVIHMKVQMQFFNLRHSPVPKPPGRLFVCATSTGCIGDIQQPHVE